MRYDLFVDSVKDFLPYLLKVNLYDEGEPLLNKQIYQMIEYLSNHNVSSCVSSNFSFKMSDKELDRLLDCGLEHLIIAIDGTTQETYEKYRVGGNIDLVISNTKRLLERQRARRKFRLKVELQFIEFEDNKEQSAGIYKLAQELEGLWRLTFIQGSSREGWVGTRFTGTEYERRKKGCYQIYTALTINSDGGLGTCDYGEDHGLPILGLAKHYQSHNLRNHPTMVRLRRSFRDQSVPLDDVCQHCSLYRK